MPSKIRLRNKRLADSRDDYKWQTDPELARLDATFALDISFARYLAEYAFEIGYPSPKRREFAIELDRKHIGNCVYYNINEAERKAEMGIMIGDPDCWNKGYGTEAITALLTHIFNNTKLEQVYLATLDWNTRAQKCFRKCGFKPCGQLVRDGSTFIVMSTDCKEWQVSQTPTKQKTSAQI